MRFMMMVKHSENQGPPPQGFMEVMAKLGEDAVKAGTMVISGGLAATAASTRVRLSKGQINAIDGPFTEAKEVLGGYWMIEVKSREEAIAWAKRCPASSNEIIEIRQVMEMSDFPADVAEAVARLTDL